MAQKRSTFSVAFYIRRTRINKHGEAAIVVRVTVDGIRGDRTSSRKQLIQNFGISLSVRRTSVLSLQKS